MNLKMLLLTLTCLCSVFIQAQSSPVKLFSLKQEPTTIPADSLGTTLFYSVSFEAAENQSLTSAVFRLKSSITDSIIHQQTFNLPQQDGVFQAGSYSNGLIRDKSSYFILLGNIKSTEPLKLVTDFTSGSGQYLHIVPNQ